MSRYELERWGFKWLGHDHGTHSRMDDGYWTPHHVAQEAIRTLSKERDMAVEALSPFAKMGKMLEGPFAPALFKDEDSFVSGGAWRENGEVRTLTFGDLRRAYSTLTQLEASKGEG